MTDRAVAIPKDQIADFCQRWQVTELALFGSVLRQDFQPASDVDILISFAPEAHWGLCALAQMQEEVEAILGRKADLVSRRAVEQSDNYIRRKSILSNLEVVYAA